MNKNNNGFSLVELSIVLVILGLLVGGILGGQALIHAAELRKVTQDVNTYRTAVYTFRDKYFGMPGDINNATQFWGAADANAANCTTTQGTGTQTCNGNNDGAVTQGAESYRFWQQLVNAGLINGDYTGVPGPSPWSTRQIADQIGINIPKIYGGNVGIVIVSEWTSANLWYTPPSSRSNAITISTCCNGLQKNIEGGGFLPEDAWNIDKKLDDGEADNGIVQIYRGYWANCTTANTAPAQYQLGGSTARCQLLIDARL